MNIFYLYINLIKKKIKKIFNIKKKIIKKQDDNTNYPLW